MLTCYEWVAVPHYSGNAPVTLLFPRGHWVLVIPGHQQLLLCLGHRQPVTVVHVGVVSENGK